MIHLLQRLEKITRHRYSLLTVASSLSIIWFILTIATISNYPSPMHDEVIWIGIARQFLAQGNFGWSSIPRSLWSASEHYFCRAAVRSLHCCRLQTVRFWAPAGTLGSSGCLFRLCNSTGVVASTIIFCMDRTIRSRTIPIFLEHFLFLPLRKAEILGLLGGLGLLYWFICTHNKASPVTVVGWGLFNTLMLDTHLSYVHLLVLWI